MGFRVRTHIKILPGIQLNIGKRGVSTSIGMKGAHVTVGHGQVRETVGLPGIDMSYTHVDKTHQGSARLAPAARLHKTWRRCARCPFDRERRPTRG